MKIHRWPDIFQEQLNPLCARQCIHGAKMTVARICLKKGAVVPLHRHENEQITILQEGKLRFVLDGQEVILAAGEMLEIDPDMPHSVEALEDSVATDLFSPVREDWKRGDDAYLRTAAR